jgi:hypothetical protein
MRIITEEDIYRFYLGDIIVGEMYNSPIPGREDDTPSFQLFEHRDTGKLKWLDYGLTDQFGKDPANLVQYLRYLPLTHRGYHDAKRLMEREVQFGMVGKPLTKLSRRATRDTIPYIKPAMEWRKFELDYWMRFQITQAELDREDIQPLGSLSWAGKGGGTHLASTEDDPTFVYWWNKNPASWKLYRPLSPKKIRFRQENVDGVIEGWNSLQRELEGPLDILFILSSTKDRLVVKHAYPSPWINAINPRGEADRVDIVNLVGEINNFADRVIILYDADDPGWAGAQTMSSLTGWECFNTMGVLPTKDFSDYVDTQRGGHSYNGLTELINKIIK